MKFRVEITIGRWRYPKSYPGTRLPVRRRAKAKVVRWCARTRCWILEPRWQVRVVVLPELPPCEVSHGLGVTEFRFRFNARRAARFLSGHPGVGVGMKYVAVKGRMAPHPYGHVKRGFVAND